MNNILFRPMEVADLPRVMEMERLCFHDAWSREMFVGELTHNRVATYTVAMNEEQIVGYGGFWLIVGEAEITTLSVHPDYQSQGFGEAMLTHMMGQMVALDAKKIFLEVRASNHAAQKLYHKMGFKQFNVRRNYYADNQEDAIVMGVQLDEARARFACPGN